MLRLSKIRIVVTYAPPIQPLHRQPVTSLLLPPLALAA
jgi:hypothetical protein